MSKGKAKFKINNGNPVLLCSECSTIIKYSHYFTEEEWANIVSVFENLHPYMIMMERKGRPLKFYIDFPKLELETGYMYTSLYWFPDVIEIKYHKEVSSADRVEYTHLDGNWYIVEETYER